MNSDFDDEAAELKWMTELSRETGRPVWFLLTDRYRDPQRWRRLIAGVHQARAEGGHLTAQVAGRPVGVLLGVATVLNPFSIREGYQEILALPHEQRLQRLRDPQVRERILKAKVSPQAFNRLSQFRQQITTRWDRMYVIGTQMDYEPTADKSIAASVTENGFAVGGLWLRFI